MNKTYIIAEAGVNHNGSVETAKKMIIAAKEAGADAIKFQTFITENLVTKSATKARYQKQTTDSEESQFKMLKRLELSVKDYSELKKMCECNHIDFMSTPFDLESLDLLLDLNVDRIKIPSGEITNYPLLVNVAKSGKKVIMSSGMCSMKEVEMAVRVLKEYGVDDLSLLHCTTEYPAPYNEVNLRVMETMREQLKLPIGYSDHTKGIEVSLAAVAMGAEIIEKHFTLDCNMEGPDHKASLEPDELKQMVKSIRNIEVAIGDGIKKAAESEKGNIEIARKSIVAKKKIEAGEYFSEDNITTKRPGTGISPMKWNEVIGKKALRDFAEDEMIVL